jgi:hypothetical protein
MKTRRKAAKPKSKPRRRAPARRSPEAGLLLLRPEGVPGALVLLVAVIALLAAFHSAHSRLSPAKKQLAAQHAAGIGE